MKILFCGGGTAGHINPSLALAEELKRNGEVAVFLSREGGSENSLIEEEGYKLLTYRVAGLKKTPTGIIRALYLAVRAESSAKKILKEEKPDIVFCTGGYVSYPVLKQAIKLKIPTALHESNIKKGLVTRLLSRKCDLVMLPLGYTEKLSSNERLVGTPVKRRFSVLSRAQARRTLSLSDSDILVLSLGGSLGAKAINDAVINTAGKLIDKNHRLRWIHSAGSRYFEEIKAQNPELLRKKSFKILPYIKDMPTYLCAADLVISRCGAVTLSEILEAKIPAVLIPSPNVADDHQRENASKLLPKGAAIVIDESELSAENLYAVVGELIQKPDKRDGMKRAYKLEGQEAPREKICSLLYGLLERNR